VTCEQARDLFSARADDALSPAEAAELAGHLATCAECHREWARFERTVALVRGIEPAHAPVGFVDRVLAARPRPWWSRLGRGLFVPWPVKLPLEAGAVVLVAGLAIMIFQRSPELQQSARAPQAPPVVTTAPVESPAKAAPEPPPETARERQPSEASAPEARPATTAESRPDSTETVRGMTGQARLFTPERADQSREPSSTADARAKRAAAPPAALRKESAPAGRPGVEDKTAAVTSQPAVTSPPAVTPPPAAAPPAAPSAAAQRPAEPPPPPAAAAPKIAGAPAPEARALDRARANALANAQGFIPAPSLEARLAVGDRAAAEASVRDLVTRTGGQVLSSSRDGDAAVLGIVVPADRWDEVRRGLETLGTLRVPSEKVEGQTRDSAGRLSITLRLER